MLGAVAAGGGRDDVQEHLDIPPTPSDRVALTVNGDSMKDAHIADGDVVLMEPVRDPSRLKPGIVSALVAGGGTTLKHFHRRGGEVSLEAAFF